MSESLEGSRTRLRREPNRGNHERSVIYELLDSAPICHLGFIDEDGHPIVVPTIHARIDDQLYVHGSVASRMLKQLAKGASVCCTITHVDGVVLARSTFWSSMNYRSVKVFGQSRLVTDENETERAINAIIEHVAPGRVSEVRPPTSSELRQTKIIAISIDEASAKVRTGDPNDDPNDLESDVWAGVLPLTTTFGDPLPAANLNGSIEIPESVKRLLADS